MLEDVQWKGATEHVSIVFIDKMKYLKIIVTVHKYRLIWLLLWIACKSDKITEPFRLIYESYFPEVFCLYMHEQSQTQYFHPFHSPELYLPYTLSVAYLVNYPGYCADNMVSHLSYHHSCGKCCLTCSHLSIECTGWVPPTLHCVSSSTPFRTTSPTWLPTRFWSVSGEKEQPAQGSAPTRWDQNLSRPSTC